MRIHTSASREQIRDAIQQSGAYAASFSEHGSRSHPRAFDVKLEGSSRRRPNGGNYGASYGAGSGYAATWDEWGIFLAALYAIDPYAKSWAYVSVADFHWKTADRFADGKPDDMHGDHTFRYSVTPYQNECTKCSAVRKWARS